MSADSMEREAARRRAEALAKQQQAAAAPPPRPTTAVMTERYSPAAPVATPAAVAPAPAAPPPPRPQDWLNADLQSAAEKQQTDLGLQSELARMLYERNSYEAETKDSQQELDQAAPDIYTGVADSYAGRGLLNSSLYDKADDEAYSGIQDQRRSLTDALSDYSSQYDMSTQQKKQAAEAAKRNIEASAMSRYAELYGSFGA